jgi:hypothetical protein
MVGVGFLVLLTFLVVVVGVGFFVVVGVGFLVDVGVGFLVVVTFLVVERGSFVVGQGGCTGTAAASHTS